MTLASKLHDENRKCHPQRKGILLLCYWNSDRWHSGWYPDYAAARRCLLLPFQGRVFHPWGDNKMIQEFDHNHIWVIKWNKTQHRRFKQLTYITCSLWFYLTIWMKFVSKVNNNLLNNIVISILFYWWLWKIQIRIIMLITKSRFCCYIFS